MLTEIQCKNAACPADKKRVRLTDGNGLYLEVSPAGSKRWFWKTYADGKEGRLALGSYPEVTLKSARLARDAARRDRADGIDPVQARKLAKLKSVVAEGETFKATAEEWYGKNASRWSSHCAIRDLKQALPSSVQVRWRRQRHRRHAAHSRCAPSTAPLHAC